MNWDAIGAIGEMIGSVAVLATLGYLAVQIGYVRRQMAREASQARWDSLREIHLAMFGNPDYFRAMQPVYSTFAERAGVPAFSPLGMKMLEMGVPPEVTHQFSRLQWALWFYREQGILFISELTPEQRVQFDHALRSVLASWTPEYAWYIQNKPTLNPEAVRYIDNVLAQSG